MWHLPCPEASLREASVEKFDRVCRKLELEPGDRLLEIGGGWGGFAIHAAAKFGCRVTTTTISSEQHRAILDRVRNEGLSDLITVLQADYRDLSGEFDKLASIEMIEAVGHENLDAYFRKCGELLAPDGSMLLQAIVMPDAVTRAICDRSTSSGATCFPADACRRWPRYSNRSAARPIFAWSTPGISRPTTPRRSRRWRQAFNERVDQVRTLGYSTELIRLWNYYLCYCEAAFLERQVGLMQIQFNKPNCRDGLWEDAR